MCVWCAGSCAEELGFARLRRRRFSICRRIRCVVHQGALCWRAEPSVLRALRLAWSEQVSRVVVRAEIARGETVRPSLKSQAGVTDCASRLVSHQRDTLASQSFRHQLPHGVLRLGKRVLLDACSHGTRELVGLFRRSMFCPLRGRVGTATVSFSRSLDARFARIIANGTIAARA